MADPRALLHTLLTTPAVASIVGEDAGAFFARHQAATAGFSTTIERAAVGGFAADRLGWAFSSGYSEALRRMVPALSADDGPAALCATEEGSAHPRAIKTSLSPGPDGGFVLSGRKQFVTFGTLAKRLFIVATEGEDGEGRSRLAVVCVPADREGVLVQPLPALPFTPEIPHASVELAGVRVAASERLPGDGYERYLKPFRTLEDSHVMAALLGWLVQVLRRAGAARSVVQELLLLVLGGCGLMELPPLDDATHIALGAWLLRIECLLKENESLWAAVDAETRARWERDRPLLRIAGKVRAQRLAAAWQRLDADTAPTYPRE